ncbi:hypothetical protein AWW66_22390 [Micromonospora rosaria]|uniref:Uncharacterized protein n=1 Tax=Micromonospora rosaria TaxID=47874 RepID=A0A136PN95_9ACTN|nr:hypothetical protein [Micromonospora rosaria]KXK59776.1 hypothetical protein AWW66_22390 [Micromonospora rosaria]
MHAGLTEARRLPDRPTASAGTVLAGLRAARADADRAAAQAATVRRTLAAAEDRVRRTGGPTALAAARHWAAANARLGLVVARLAVGGVALDRYAAALTSAAVPPGRAMPGPVRVGAAGPVTAIAAGALAAGRLVGAARRRVRPGRWARLRDRVRREVRG